MPGTSGNIISYRRKFRSQIFDSMDRWKKQRWEESEMSREEERRSEKRKSAKKEGAGARKGTRVAVHCVFQWFAAPEGQELGSLKRRVRSHVVRCEMKNCTPLWCEAHFEAKMYNAHHSRTTFGKLRYRKSARPCSAKHIWKSNVLKTDGRGPLLEAEMLKICTLVWREARLEVKMSKKHRMLGPLLKVQMWFCLAGARDFAPCQKWAKDGGFLAASTTTIAITTARTRTTTTLHYIPLAH